ncbi:MAG: NTP transferase domain-containing protein [Planctomycetota bacterium]|nr:NTP transferase domain-containing protein [Planctomycetota bacterium]MDP6763713.1 NTP transferase domain-containing protein [Planctomycetota bacterium]MDP6990148.1 NTP transferase domain-containing protein [Planctomycetota bacterium]
MKPALVLLAAGASTRLGCCKALVELGGSSPLARLLDAGACLDEVAPLVVAGADHEALAAAVPPGVDLIHHRAWAAGRSGGIVAAAGARPGRDLCLAPVDVPLVPAEVFEALARAWSEAGAPGGGWLAPRHGGRHGHPVVVGRELVAGLAASPPDTPLRDVRGRADPLLAVPVRAREVLDDLDRPADLDRLRERFPPP